MCRFLQHNLISQQGPWLYLLPFHQFQQYLACCPSQLPGVKGKGGDGRQVAGQNGTVVKGCHLHLFRHGNLFLPQLIQHMDADRIIQAGGTSVRISGLELPLSCYKKGKKPYLKEDGIKKLLGSASKEHLQILLAHHPAFAGQYAAWGADVTVCGHNHGGLVCIPGLGSVISPQFIPFPKYDAGEFTIGGRKVYISRGLGTHTFHIRVFNRAELVVISIKPGQDAGMEVSK